MGNVLAAPGLVGWLPGLDGRENQLPLTCSESESDKYESEMCESESTVKEEKVILSIKLGALFINTVFANICTLLLIV